MIRKVNQRNVWRNDVRWFSQTILLLMEAKKYGETRGICGIKDRFLDIAGSTLEVYILLGMIHTRKGENSDVDKGDYCQSLPLPGWGKN